ncbi:MAG: sugar ABC transporter ATP-binding protein [Pseudorhodoplanes sp.]
MTNSNAHEPQDGEIPSLSARGLSKSYGPVRALDEVSIEFFAGEVHGLVGENGAGKTTLMRLLAGEEPPTGGHIEIGGQPVDMKDPAAAKGNGIVIVHQHFQLVNTMTVSENMCLGEPPLHVSLGPLSLVDYRTMADRSRERLRDFGLDDRVHDRVGDLTVAERQLVEISRAMTDRARILILDEPTASLGAAETRELFRHVMAMRERGAAIILIAHNIDEVLELSDRISVLRNGRLVTTQKRSEIDYDSIVRAIVGRELQRGYIKKQVVSGAVALKAEGFLQSEGNKARPIEIARSEIVGVPTYVGAMVDRLFSGLSGTRRAPGTKITVDHRDVSHVSLKQRIKAGICLIPGDAVAEGLIPAFSIEDNILLPNLARFRKFGFVQRKKLRETVENLIRELDIRPADPAANVMSLSGGNRQKVVIAKWLAAGARVMLMNDPTKAVDVGAKAEIYRLLGNVVSDGGAILLVSSDMDELIGLSDRILVLRGSTLVEEFPQHPVSKESLMAAVVGSRQIEGVA